MQTARTLEAEWRRVLWESVGTGAKEDESSTGRVWAAGFSPRYGPFSLGARFENYKPFISLIFFFFSDRVKPRITETADTESVDTGARLYLSCQCDTLYKTCINTVSHQKIT
jgi:hypothetical protein